MTAERLRRPEQSQRLPFRVDWQADLLDDWHVSGRFETEDAAQAFIDLHALQPASAGRRWRIVSGELPRIAPLLTTISPAARAFLNDWLARPRRYKPVAKPKPRRTPPKKAGEQS